MSRNVESDARKLPFSKEEMFGELRHILLIEASRIDLMRGNPATKAFIGFEYTGNEYEPHYSDEFRKKINLADFEIATNLSLAYDYAFQRSNWHQFNETVEARLRGVAEGFSHYGPEGEPSPYHSDNSLCRRAVDAAIARYHLENYDASMSIYQLALLANMSEAAVRNSLSAENIKAEGKPASINADEALKWLAGRRGYISSRGHAKQGETLEGKTRRLFDNSDFKLSMLVLLQEETPTATAETLADRTGIEIGFIKKLIEGEPEIDIAKFCKIADALQLDAPKFAGYSLECALRAGK